MVPLFTLFTIMAHGDSDNSFLLCGTPSMATCLDAKGVISCHCWGWSPMLILCSAWKQIFILATDIYCSQQVGQSRQPLPTAPWCCHGHSCRAIRFLDSPVGNLGVNLSIKGLIDGNQSPDSFHLKDLARECRNLNWWNKMWKCHQTRTTSQKWSHP